LFGYTEQICPTLIPPSHNGETSQNDSLHKALISCSIFRGKDNNNLHKLFRDNLHEIDDRLFNISADVRNAPEDYYIAIPNAIEATGDIHTVELDPHKLLQLFKLFKIVKVGGVHSPYACIEWPGIQNAQARLILPD
jgi:hypothetical protein